MQKKERSLKKQQREALLLDSYLTSDVTTGRSLRDRKPVTYTFGKAPLIKHCYSVLILKYNYKHQVAIRLARVTLYGIIQFKHLQNATYVNYPYQLYTMTLLAVSVQLLNSLSCFLHIRCLINLHH
jgi:hypothetical protein